MSNDIILKNVNIISVHSIFFTIGKNEICTKKLEHMWSFIFVAA